VDSGSEYLIDDLTALKGDTVISYRFGRLPEPFIINGVSDTVFFNNRTNIKTYQAGGLETWRYNLAEGFGLVEVFSGDDNRCFTYTLKGAVINGIVYGDTSITGIINTGNVPHSFILFQNYPNPFNPSTTITYELPKYGLVQLKIYDILGREIATLMNDEQSAGKHTINFNTQQIKNQLSSGVYFYRLKFGSSILNKKMILVR
jgi:hypothetical protein